MMPDMGKHAASGRRARFSMPRGKMLFATIAAVALVVAAIGGAAAWLVASDAANNQFKLAQVEPVVDETLNDDAFAKENVSVKNEGLASIPIYVRARVEMYLQDADGVIQWHEVADSQGSAGASSEVDIDYGNVSGQPDASDPKGGTWVLANDGYYYWTRPVGPDSSTGLLFESIKPIVAYDDDTQFVVDIIAQGIQADPAEAVQQAWGVTIDDDGTLFPPAATSAATTGSDASAATDITAEEA